MYIEKKDDEYPVRESSQHIFLYCCDQIINFKCVDPEFIFCESVIDAYFEYMRDKNYQDEQIMKCILPK